MLFVPQRYSNLNILVRHVPAVVSQFSQFSLLEIFTMDLLCMDYKGCNGCDVNTISVMSFV